MARDGYGMDPQPHKPSLGERYAEMWLENWNSKQSLSGSLAALFREAVKDVRATLHEAYFGKGEHSSEPGAPLTPTQQQVTAEAGNFHGYDQMIGEAASAGKYINRSEEIER